MEENQTQEKEEPRTEETPVEDIKDGDKPKEFRAIDDANLAAKRMEEATKALEVENDRKEKLQIDAKFAGSAEAGMQPEKPEKLTDSEYSEALEKGEVNPMKEDGIKF